MTTPVPSSTHPTPGPSSSSAALAFRGDAAASICAYLILNCSFPCGHIAHNLGLPSLVVEECVRNGESSPALRAQLGQWLQENSRVTSRVPPFLVHALHEACVEDEQAQQHAARQRHLPAASPSVTPHSTALAGDEGDDGSLFNALDPASREHFTTLRNSVGQSFISILNDPGEATEDAAWGSWLGGKLYDVFDYNGRPAMGAGRLEDALRLLRQQHQRDPDSSTSLLQQHPPRTDFSDYVRTVASAYNTNRKESREVRQSAFLDDKVQPESLSWPRDVPGEFFERQHSIRREVEDLPAPLPTADNPIMLLPSTTTGKGADDFSALANVKIVGPNTFRRDFDALEERSRQLRAWEAEVERCLLKHVQSRSEDFFHASTGFTQLNNESEAAMVRAREVRTGAIAKGSHSLHNLLAIGALYRRQQNFHSLRVFLGRSLTVFNQLQEIDNWVSLPEREMAELPTVVRRLLELEAFLHPAPSSSPSTAAPRSAPHKPGGGDEDGAGGVPQSPHPSPPLDTWQRMSRLHVMKDVPQRAVVARRDLEDLVRAEVITCLSRDLSDAAAVPRAVQAVEAAALLGVMEAALLAFQSSVVRAQWSATQESVIAFLMSSNTLDDARANELLSHSTASAGTTAARTTEPSTEEKKALLQYTNDCRFPAFLGLLSHIADALLQDVARTTQNWGFALTRCFPQGLGSGYAKDSVAAQLVRQATRAVLGAVCTHAESTVAMLVDVRSSSKVVTNVTEVEKIARQAYSFLAEVTQPVRLLAALPDLPLEGLMADGTPSEDVGASGGGFVRVGKHVQAAVHRLAKRHLKTQHTRQMENLQMVVESETWSPKEDIDAIFQNHVERMCKWDAEAVAVFDAQCVETVNPSMHDEEKSSANAGAWRAVRTKTSGAALDGAGRGRDRDDDDADADLLNAKANKLYLSLDGDDAGRVVGNSLLILVELLDHDVGFLAKFPSLAFDVVAKIYELLALYDSLCASMVLGARAMEKGTLKSITTTNLCVASQSCAFLSDFIPLLQKCLMTVLRVGGETVAAPAPAPAAAAYISSSSRKLLPFIQNDLGRVAKDCSSHRNDFFRKMASLVEAKVDSLGAMEGANGEWTARGNEWVMTMLREVARLIRALRPLLPSQDLRGVIVPLLSSLAVRIREVARCVPESNSDARTMAASDVLLFKLNVERFGFDVLRCAGISSVSAAMDADDLSPVATDQEALAWFFAPRTQAPQQQQHQWASGKK